MDRDPAPSQANAGALLDRALASGLVSGVRSFSSRSGLARVVEVRVETEREAQALVDCLVAMRRPT